MNSFCDNVIISFDSYCVYYCSALIHGAQLLIINAIFSKPNNDYNFSFLQPSQPLKE